MNNIKGDKFEPEYQAVLDYAIANSISTPSKAINIRNNQRVKRLKDSSLYNRIDLLYFFDQESGKEEFAKLNYINPSDYTIYNSSGLLSDFVADFGFKSDRTKFIKTGWIPSIDAVNFSNTSASIFYKGFDNINDGLTNQITGCRTGNNTGQINIRNTNNAQLFRLMSTSSAAVFNNNRNNNSILLSGTTASTVLYQNGVSQFGLGAMLGSLNNQELYLLALNDNGTVNGVSAYGLKYFGIMNSGNSTDADNLYKILEDIT